jgi:hypothetical protein
VCLIIDANTIPMVFDAQSEHHHKFLPVLKWVTEGNGRIVYGGTKYKKELRLMTRYLRLIARLYTAGKVVILPNAPIDEYALNLKKIITSESFDDEHLVAIVATSGCRVVCTQDKTAHKYLVRQDLYPKGIKRPKIYSGASTHAKLCSATNISHCCR